MTQDEISAARADSSEGRATAARAADPFASIAPRAATGEDRRNIARRRSREARFETKLERPEALQPMIPAGWRYLPLFMLLVTVTCVARARQLPGATEFLAIATGIGLGALLGWLRHRELFLEGWRRFSVVVVASALPLLLFASGVAGWAETGALDSSVALAALAGTAMLTAVFSRSHPGLLLATQMAVWGPVILAGSSPAGLLGLAVSGLAAILVTREFIRAEREQRQVRDANQRVLTRASDILSDYEETGQGWFWETDRRSLLTYLSRPVAELLGREPHELLGQPLTVLFDSEQKPESERTLGFHLSARSAFQDVPMRAAVGEGDERWWSLSGRPVYDHFDNFVGFRGSGTDLTEQRRSEAEVTRLATFDSLTGLANRFQMAQSLERILSAPQEMHRCCAVFLLDLDRFKHVNDTLGHPVGDLLLQQVAQRVERVVGKMGKVGRLGGDEFKVIIPNRIERGRLGELAARIINVVSQPYSLDGHTAVIGTSLGIALAPADGTSTEELIRNADLALYAAKDGGRGRFHFYAKELHAEAEARSQLEKDLRNAIVQGELEMQYQPVVATASERIAGFEALMRWKHPVRGWVCPTKFISIAEDSGLIPQLGEWALRTACQDLARWPEEVRCAVNVSPLQFANPNLPSILTHAIAQAGVDPSRLELEITESVFLNDDEGTEAMFAALKRVGVRLALDDFGTGYSSLGYLKKAPFDKIKIDQSFVRGATQPNSRNGAIIASITSLAQNLGMDTTAEGVETLDELDLVRMHGCSHVQGYIYAKPLTAEEATVLLETGLTAVAKGPRAARQARRTTLRKVLLDHQGQIYTGTVRNISADGAMIEGLWNVPTGTVFQLELGSDVSVGATTRWSHEGRIGVEFATQVTRDQRGRLSADGEAAENARPLLRKAG